MLKLRVIILTVLLSLPFVSEAQGQLNIYGRIISQAGRLPITGARIEILNSNYTISSDKNGSFFLHVPRKQHLTILVYAGGYEKKIKEIEADNVDSLFLNIVLKERIIGLDSVTVKTQYKPDTLVHSGKFSIYDFDFYEDGFILLTAEKGMDKAELKLSDANGKILHSKLIPKEAGKAKELHRDYMGYTNVLCENAIYRIVIFNQNILIFPLKPEDFDSFIKPVIDTVKGKLIFSDYWKEYPMFSYYSYSEKEKSRKQLVTVSNEDLLQMYNMEYYYLKPRERLEALELADKYKADKRVVAALMSGFTKSMYYDPLYAPLFIVKDTICVFDHYKDMLFHFDQQGKKLDSIVISYNHPKNWREWKKLMIKDDVSNSIYAVYSKNGHQYLKYIDHRTGKDNGKYTIQFHSAEKIKARDGYIYYVYRPFESTQERFLYRELIRLEK